MNEYVTGDRLEQYRRSTQDILARCHEDPAFQKSLEADPEQTLSEFGLPQAIFDEISSAMHPNLRCGMTCRYGTSECTRSILV